MYPQYAGEFQGEIEGSAYFWGDVHKKMITYNRNHEFRNLNTLAVDPKTPYIDPKDPDFQIIGSVVHLLQINWFSTT